MLFADYLIAKHNGIRKYGNPDEISIICPSCGKGENHFSFNIRKNIGNCYRCNYSPGNIESLIQKLEGVDEETASLIAIYGSDRGSKAEAVIEILGKNKEEKKIEKEEHINAELPKEFILMVDVLRNPSIQIPTYFKERGYSTEIIKNFRIGYCQDGEYKARIIFPVETEDKKSFVARRIHSWMERKYKNPPNTKHEQLLYNYNRLPKKNQIFVCEGVTDVLRLVSYSFHATCTFGKKISSEQIELLKKIDPKEVVVCYDGDALDSNLKAFEKLSYYVNTSFVVLPKKSDTEYYDPDDAPKSIFYNCVVDRIGMSKVQNSIRILENLKI